MARLFEKFRRIEEGKNHSVEGTGLGMSITIQLLKLMDSVLELDSTYGGVSLGADNIFCLSTNVQSGSKTSKAGITGMVSYLTGNSIALVSVDDEARIVAGGNFDVDANNFSDNNIIFNLQIFSQQ